MKNFALSLSTIVIICLVGWIIFAQECKRTPEGEIPEGYTLIRQEALDSLEMIADMPADTVYIDTTEKEIEIRWLDPPIPEPVALDTGINYYTDTLITDSLSIWAQLWIRGELERWSFGGRSTVTQIDRIVEIPKPVVVTNNIEVPVIEREIFLGLQTGGSPAGGLLFGIELTYQNRKANYYGLGASRFGEFNIYEFKFGRRILHW